MKAGTLTLLIALCLPISVSATTLRLSSEVDLLVLDGKRSPALSCAVQTVLNSKMVHISWYFVSKKQFRCPVTENASTSHHLWSPVLILS